MFDIGASELLVLVIVAIVVIGPKDLPMALRTAGRWVAKMRRVSNHFKSGIETMIREAEMEEMERKWKEQNERIMRETAAQHEAAEQGQTPAAAEDQNDPVMIGPMPPETKLEETPASAPATVPGGLQP